MRILIDYAGNRYEAEPVPNVAAEEAKTQLYENLELFNKFETRLKGAVYSSAMLGGCVYQEVQLFTLLMPLNS